MGKFGKLISQSDSIYDLIDNLRHGQSLDSFYKDGGYYGAFNTLLDGNSSSLDIDYSLDIAIYLVALAVESVNKGFVHAEYYGSKNSPGYTTIKAVSYESISKEAVKTSKLVLKSLVSIVKNNKESFTNNSFKHESLYDAMGVDNKVPFSNEYEYYKAVLNNLIEGFKTAMSEGAKEDNPSSKGNEFVWDIYSYDYKRQPNGLYVVPEVDSKMLSTGFDKVLRLETYDRARCYYLAKEVSDFGKGVLGLFKNMFDDHKEFYRRYVENTEYYKFRGINEELYEDMVDCRFSISEVDENTLELVGQGLGSNKFHGKISKEEFWSSTGKYVGLNKVVGSVLSKYTSMGLDIDSITFYLSAQVFTDFEKSYKNVKTFGDYKTTLCMEGISRIFESIWRVPENPFPVKEDSYEVIVFMGINKDFNPTDIRVLRACAKYCLKDYLEEGYNDFVSIMANDMYGIDIDEDEEAFMDIAEKLLKELENTPHNKEITSEGISDAYLEKEKGLLEW